MSKDKLVIGKYYRQDKVCCTVSTEKGCWKSDFCDTGILTKECISCKHLEVKK